MWKPAECQTTSLEIAALLQEPNFIFEEKMDGLRAICEVGANGNIVTGRNGTEITKPQADYLRAVKFKDSLGGSVFDGELMPDGRYFIFDILKWDREDIRDKKLEFRKVLLGSCRGFLTKNVEVIDSWATFRHVELLGFFEGVVVKDLRSKYGFGWFKAKRVETDDLFVVSIDRETGVADVGCGKVSGVPYLVRVGDCIEVEFFERFASGKLRSGRYVRLRDDKSKRNHDDEHGGLRPRVAAGCRRVETHLS